MRIPRTGTAVRIAGVVFSIIFLWLAFRGLDGREILRASREASPGFLLLALACNALLILLKTVKWRLILSPIKKVSFFNLLSASLVGFASSNLLPARVGELTKVYVISRTESLKALPVLGTVALDRILEGAGMFVVMFVVFAGAATPVWLKTAGLSVSGVSLLLLPALYFLSSTKLGDRIVFLARLKEGLLMLRNPSLMVSSFALSIFIWLVQVSIVEFVFLAFHLSLPAWAPFLFVVAINLAIAVPSLPSGIGALEYVGISSLLYLNVSRESAAGLVLVYHFIMAVPVTALGVLAFLHSGLRFKDVTSDELQRTGPAPQGR